MELQFLTSNIDSPHILIPQLRKEYETYFSWKAYKEYNPREHKVNDTSLRKDKIVTTEATAEDGSPGAKTTSIVKVNRISAPYQKLIVSRSAAFLTGGAVTLSAQTEEGTPAQRLLDRVNETWRANKLQYKNNLIARRMMSETECCEVWYSKTMEDGSIQMRCNIYSPSMGYDLMPVWDTNRDMIAFGLYREDATITKSRYLDLYTKETIKRYRDTGSGWALVDTVPLNYGKIPVIYYNIEQSAWEDVQPLIERVEYILSNFADTNDYHASPTLFFTGGLVNMAQKGETGKIIVGEDGATAQYVTWPGAPEAIRLELETLNDLIYTCTQTPNISFEQMKGLGAISGVAYDRIMIDAHLKAKDMQEGEYGEGIQRRLNFLISACAATTTGLSEVKDLEITPIFSLFRIDDEADRITNAMKANGGKPVVSHKTSIKMAGLTDDPDGELEEIQAQEEEEVKNENPDIPAAA